jgi:hypothetical protein
MPLRFRLLAAVVLMTALIFPLFLTEIPPVVDYPNHLARAYLLAFGKADPVLAKMFDPRWGIIPNLASDILLPPILHLVPLYSAGKIVLAISLLLPLLGGWTYSYCLFGRWSFWSLGAVFVAFNLTFLLGFLNFQIGMGMAFFMAAAWVRWRERRPAVALAAMAAGAIAVFFCHLIGLALLMVLVGVHELDWLLGTTAGERRAQILRRLAALVLVFTPSLILYLCSPASEAEGRLVWLSVRLKSLLLLAPLLN